MLGDPELAMSPPNEPVLLHRGPLEVHDGSPPFAGVGEVRLAWFPRPRVEFEVSKPFAPKDLRPPGQDLTLELGSLGASLPGYSTSVSETLATAGQGVSKILGIVSQGTIGGQSAVTRVEFYIPNFPFRFGQELLSVDLG